jgi:hypothetical protein
VTYGENLNDETFKEKLGLLSIKQLIRNAKERRAGAMGVAEVMVIEYNGRKKSASQHRLQIQKLYTKPKKEKEQNPDSMDLFDDEDLSDLDETEDNVDEYSEDTV